MTMHPENITFVKVSATEYIVSGECKLDCGFYTTARFPATALFAYQRGIYIQTAFDMLSASDREFIRTGISAKGWDALETEV
jgi:hypothetical protein